MSPVKELVGHTKGTTLGKIILYYKFGYFANLSIFLGFYNDIQVFGWINIGLQPFDATFLLWLLCLAPLSY